MTRIGFFAGSFDPPTLGHVDIVERSLRIVDKLVVGVGRNADKSSWLPLELRLELLREVLPADVSVMPFDGLAVTAAREAGATVLVRGVRGPDDVAGELQMSRANQRLDSDLETILIPAAVETAHVSSRLVREVHRAAGDVTIFVPRIVAAALSEQPGSAQR